MKSQLIILGITGSDDEQQIEIKKPRIGAFHAFGILKEEKRTKYDINGN